MPNNKKITENEKWKDFNFNDLEWIVSYYIDKKNNNIITVKRLKDDEVPEEVKEHFRKLGYMK